LRAALRFWNVTRNYKPRILIFSDFYLPGYKSGGGVRSLVNLVERLGDKFEFRVVARDHDGWTDKTPYRTVKINDWNQIGKAQAFFLSKDQITLRNVKKLIEETSPKSIYANSYFGTLTMFLALLRKLGKFRDLPLIIGPGGELSTGSLNNKKGKKQVYLKMAGAINLYENVIWRAASDFEKNEIERIQGRGEQIFIVPDMPPKQIFPEFDIGRKPFKKKGELNLIYLSRLHPVKNLKFLLEILPNIEDKVVLDIFGPVDHHEYARECGEIIENFPPHLKVTLKGEVVHENVPRTLEKYNFFILPTTGESFAHIVPEALAAGCPLIISDRTPWKNLAAKGVGWDLPLEDKTRWIEVLKRCVKLDAAEYETLSRNARNYLNSWLADEAAEKTTEELFNYSLSVK
jgi:glycosyltransferase involved in cell wall biosynthesis